MELVAKTINMQAPLVLADDIIKRKPVVNSEVNELLITYENFLRKLAYKNTIIKTGETFFDDSDMKSDYYLIVVYDKLSNTPLLSSRYYFDKWVIEKYIKADDHIQCEPASVLNLNNYKEKEIFLADRLSGNISNSIYRHYRDEIFKLFYAEMLAHNKNCNLILMARKEKNEKLLNKYLRLGFKVVGAKMHQGKEHWIVLTRL